jgi:hypothetical protein
MKILALLISLIVPALSEAGERNPLAGRYTECVRWTTYNGLETSKKFELVVQEDNRLEFTASLIEGSGDCNGHVRESRVYRDFKIMEVKGTRNFKIMAMQDMESKIHFRLVLSSGSASVFTGDSYPVKLDPMKEILLKRED